MKQATETPNIAALPWLSHRSPVWRGRGGFVSRMTFDDDFTLLQRQIEDETGFAVEGVPPASRAAAAAEVEGSCAS